MPYPQNSRLRTSVQWRNYFTSLIRHELRHVQHLVEGVDYFNEQILSKYDDHGLNPLGIHQIGDQVVDRIHLADKHYDNLTNHGELEGVRWKIN